MGIDAYDDETLAELAKYEFLEFAESIPTSSIIENNKKNKDKILVSDLKVMAYLIYEKYEINISSGARRQFIQMFGDLEVCLKDETVTVLQIVKLMETARKELKKLLRFSLSRMKTQKNWQSVETVLS